MVFKQQCRCKSPTWILYNWLGIMSFGEIYCESWWGDNNRSEGWGQVYPICSAVGLDRTDITIDNNLSVTIDMI